MQALSLEERFKALVARDTRCPVPVLVFPVVNDPRFPDERPAKGNEIGLTGLDDFLHELKAPQAANHHDRGNHMTLYFLAPVSEISLDPIVKWVQIPVGILVP
jgi:hypothetical protein